MTLSFLEPEDDSKTTLQSSHSVPNSPNPVILSRTKLHSVSVTTEDLIGKSFSYDQDLQDDGIDEDHDMTGGSDCSGGDDSGYGHFTLPIHNSSYKRLVLMSPEDKSPLIPSTQTSYQMLNIKKLDTPHQYASLNMRADHLPEILNDSDSDHECC